MMNLHAPLAEKSQEYILFVHRDRSPADAEAEHLLSDFLRKSNNNAKLNISEQRDPEDQTPALYAQLGYFTGINQIRAFIDHERLLIA